MSSENLKPTQTQSMISPSKNESSKDNTDLYNRRKRNKVIKFTSSPFVKTSPAQSASDLEIEHHPDEMTAHNAKTQDQWLRSDLLLEIAMTTAFASLTDGTEMLSISNVASYLSFFFMVWWVWTSQVAYNVRFRQDDWLHRISMFLQLLIFCALAAFTNNFDVTSGIANDTKLQNLLAQLKLEDFSSQQDIATADFRSHRLPTLNARGISLTMAFSRLVLLVQYAFTLFHVLRAKVESSHSRLTKISALFVHTGSIAFSSICYFVAYGVIGKNPLKADQISKLFLWYCPLLIELVAHFVAEMSSDYSAEKISAKNILTEKIYERSSTVFVIILGGGLDKITKGFQFIVGNVSTSFENASSIVCAAVVFILLYTLYFGMSKDDKISGGRALFSFFFQFFYLSALIVTLQGIAAMLLAGNIASALEIPFQFVTKTSSLMLDKGFGVLLNESDYGDVFKQSLNETGFALSSILEYVNSGIETGLQNNDTSLPHNYVLRVDLSHLMAVLDNFHAARDENSILMNKIYVFADNDVGNYAIVNNGTFHEIAEETYVTYAMPALWFYAAGGLVLVFLGLMNIIIRRPRDKFEWGQTISKIIIGCIVIAFSTADIHASGNILDDNFKYHGKRIWFLATHGWVLPSYALVLIVVQAFELYMASRSLEPGGISIYRKPARTESYPPAGGVADQCPPGGGSSGGNNIPDLCALDIEMMDYRAVSLNSIVSPPTSSADFGAHTRV